MISKEHITTLFVSQQNGSDENAGTTQEGALKSIEAALNYVRRLRANGHPQPITIRVLDKEYYVTSPIVIDGDISAVTIEPQTETKFCGGIKIEGFVNDTFNGRDCLSKQLDDVLSGDFWFTDLYVDGVAALFTRYPSDGFLYAKDVENNSTDLFASSKWFIAEQEDLAVIKTFQNFDDCFISYNHYWVDEHTPIKSLDAETGKIVFEYASRFTIEPSQTRSKFRYIIENVAEAFCNPGEWYLDRTSKKVYYIPLAGQTKESISVYAPVTDKLFVIKGTKEKRVSGIVIRGFELNCTKGDYRSRYKREGDAQYVYDETAGGYASDIQSVCWAHGSIEFSYAHGCRLENCLLCNMGVHAITICEGVDTIAICNNEIREIGAGAVKVDGGDITMPAYTHTHGIQITNNTIMRCGNRYFSACGILLKHAYDAEISHNDIGYLYYSGISCGWIWGYNDSITRDIRIEKNHIHHLGQGKLSDMGGVYLLGRQPGTFVRGNLIHDVTSKHYGGWGLYADEGSSQITFENNICYNLTNNGFHQHYGSYNTVRNNIFALSGEAPAALSRAEAHLGLVFENNILVSNDTTSFYIGYTEDKGPLGAQLLSIRNLCYDLSGKAPDFLAFGKKEDFKVYTRDEAQNEKQWDEGSVVGNPLFVDFEGRDFTLKEDSPAFALGFKQIDMSDVGVIQK